MKNRYVIKGLLLLSLAGGVIIAGDIETDDHDKELQIKSSVQISEKSNEVEEIKAAKVTISDVIANIQAKFSGKITKVELENKDGNLVYESELFQDDGKTLEIIVDAGNGKILASSIDEPDYEEDDEKGEEKED